MADPLRQPTAPPGNALIRLCQWLRPKLVWFWTAIGLVLILNIVTALLTTKSSDISGTALGWIRDHLLLALAGLVLLLVLTWVVYYLGRPESTPDTSAATAHENRQSMLNLVENIWITGFLENPLYYSHDEQLLSLPLRKSVGSRFDLVLSDPFRQTQPISSGTTITQVFFEQAKGELLILGEPGAGKTTLLLELTRDLLERAHRDEAYPIPVVFNLSSWATKQLPLEQWVIEELKTKYQVAPEVGRKWVKANQLLLLLDGLDEVTPDALRACIDKINEYYHQARRSLVVCSRTKEFLDQPGRLALHTAVIVQPLSSEQIDAYLDSLVAKGEDVEGLKHALHQSEDLHKLATTSLFLTVLVLAYHGKPEQELLALMKATPKDQPHLIFHNYVERMLQRKGLRLHATAEQTKHWLGWLAHQLTVHHQTELYLEYLQPDWLPIQRRVFYRWSFRPLVGLGFGLVVGLLVGLLVGLVYGLSYGLVYGLVVGLVGGLVGLLTKIVSVKELALSGAGLGKNLRAAWGGGLFFGLFIGLCFGLSFGLSFGLDWGLVVGLVGGLVGGLAGGLGFSRSYEMPPMERFIPSPNEGIRRSIKFGLFGGLFLGLFGGLCFGLFGGLSTGLVFGLVFGLSTGLVSGLYGGLDGGLGTAVQHYILRFWLWQARSTPAPWQYVAFLDDTVEQLLLRKIGGGYVFRHHLLQDYFASLESTASPQQ